MKNFMPLRKLFLALLVGMGMFVSAFLLIPWITINCADVQYFEVLGLSEWWIVNIILMLLCAVFLLTVGRYSFRDWAYVPIIGASEFLSLLILTLPITSLAGTHNIDLSLLIISFYAALLAVLSVLVILPTIAGISWLIGRKKEKEVSETLES